MVRAMPKGVERMIIFERFQDGSSAGIDTHESAYFQHIWKVLPRYVTIPLKDICDPFARDCVIAYPNTNDIDEKTLAVYHEDAAEWLKRLEDGVEKFGNTHQFDLVIFDPPFSGRQSDEKYDGHINVYTDPGYVKKCMRSIGRILKPGGYLLKFGYNSSRHLKCLVLVKMWVVNFGGNRNDVIVTLWRNEQTTLEEWC